ncbi:MAG: lipid-A-disaccharide synthase [Candidatus Omnitrophica bacterium]|nr:lipid-A-disaccharide synthase [Candidatus Omnitrophota bacterium]
MTKKIFVIAGEASGDLHGAALIRALREAGREGVEIYGVGGERIRETGALEFFDLARFHTTGFTEAIKKLPQYRRAARAILSNVEKAEPDTVVLIDNPGLNLYLAEKIHALGIPVVYYIAPQVWAWAPKRVLKIKKFIRKVLVVFEFEKKIYEENGIPVAWVGHPLKDRIGAPSPPLPPGLPKDEWRVSLLPGSRETEVKTLLPILLGAAEILSGKNQARFSLIQSPTLPRAFYEPFLWKSRLRIELVEKNAYDAIGKSDLALVCSGTATLECAILGTPMIITNKGSFLTYLAAKCLIRVPCLGLPNLILGEKKIPEFLQYDATPEKIAREAEEILRNEERRSEMKKALQKVSENLGAPGASRRAALEIFNL